MFSKPLTSRPNRSFARSCCLILTAITLVTVITGCTITRKTTIENNGSEEVHKTTFGIRFFGSSSEESDED